MAAYMASVVGSLCGSVDDSLCGSCRWLLYDAAARNLVAVPVSFVACSVAVPVSFVACSVACGVAVRTSSE